MNMIAHQLPDKNYRLAQPLQRLWETSAPLTLFACVFALFTLFFIVSIFVDSRVINGAPAWLKPTKFGISIITYVLTIAWITQFIRTERRAVRQLVKGITWTIIGVFTIEMIVVVTQVLRGTTSHFNIATPGDRTLYAIMGTAIVILWIANLILAGILLFQRFENPAFAWAIRLGLIIAIIGMALGALMTSPTAQQLAKWERGDDITVIGAHAVGVPDGGPGLPVTGWSTEGGDLRVPHFVGMHALQVIPFLGWFITRRKRWSAIQQERLVITGAAAYLGITALLTVQALRAQPITSPDAITLGLALTLMLATALAAWLIVRQHTS